MLKETAVPRCLCTDRRCLGRLDPQVHRMSMANSSEQEDIFWLATKNGGSEQPISEQEHAIQRTTVRECYSGSRNGLAMLRKLPSNSWMTC